MLTQFFHWVLCCCRPRLLVLALLLGAKPAAGFSALAHQAIVDSCWARGIAPVLEGHYPGATAAQLATARSFAYGGALLQDLGYFPGNAAFFSYLTHYVRTGDFVRALLDEARDRNELAFALGALAHYVADTEGHPTGANAVTELVFPKLRAHLGEGIPFAQAPRQHTQIEFAFDVAQVEARRYRSVEFHAGFGLQLSRRVLERAFYRTYGLPLKRVLPRTGLGLALFRFVATELLPAAARASQYRPAAQVRLLPLPERQRYYQHINTSCFSRRGARPDHLSIGMCGLVVLAKGLPRMGLVSQLAFRPLPLAAEATMRASFDQSLARYQLVLADLSGPFPNMNLDTGQPTRADDYALADHTYSVLARRLARSRLRQP
jgi:hypothetical protein